MKQLSFFKYVYLFFGDFTQNEVMKYFDYEIHKELTNARYLHENGLFVGNQQVLIYEEIKYLYETLKL